MVVDDEIHVRSGIVLQTDWMKLGCVVAAEASNGEEALDLVKQVEPDIVICDIRMPKLDGIGFLKQLRAAHYEVAVIFLTAYSDFVYTQKAIQLGAADYLLKPFEDQELIEAVEQVKHKIQSKSKTMFLREQSRGLSQMAAHIEETSPPTKDIFFKALLPSFEELQEGKKSKYVLEAIAYMNQNYADSKLTVTSIATHLELSEGHLSHVFKKETGYTVNGYLTRYRIQQAMYYLQDYHYKVYEVGDQVGYKDMTYFSSLFKKIVGVTPSYYQDHFKAANSF